MEWYLKNVKDLEDNPVKNLAFPSLSETFYKKRGVLYSTNRSRNSNEYIQRTPSQALEELKKSLLNETSSKRKNELNRMLVTIEHFIQNGPVVSIKELFNVYWGCEKKNNFNANQFFKRLQRFVEIDRLYVHLKSYVFQPSTSINKERMTGLLNSIPENVLTEEVNKQVHLKIQDQFKTALEMVTSKKDRDIIKGNNSFDNSISKYH